MSTQSQRYVGRCTIFVGKDEIEDEYGCTELGYGRRNRNKNKIDSGLKDSGHSS